MINQTTTTYLGQIFYFYYVCIPELTDAELKIYNISGALVTTIPMIQLGDTGVYRAAYVAPAIGTYVGVAHSATAEASTDLDVKVKASSVTELRVLELPSNVGSVTISNAVGVGIKCD